MKSNSSNRRFNFRASLSLPYILFMVVFVILPLLLVIFFAFTDQEYHFNWFTNWQEVLSNKINWKVIGTTLMISSLSTICCLVIAYPIAFLLSNSKINKNKILVYVFLLPMWINFVIRTLAFRAIMENVALKLFNIEITSKYPFYYIAIIIGMVYDYLPFAILPLYNQMLKMDKNQIEAAYDLGANPFIVFVKAIIPMTIPGIVSAATMTFMPTMSSYVISDYMSRNNVQIIGSFIQHQFDISRYNIGSVMSLLMLLLISLTVVFEKVVDKKSDKKAGGLY